MKGQNKKNNLTKHFYLSKYFKENKFLFTLYCFLYLCHYALCIWCIVQIAQAITTISESNFDLGLNQLFVWLIIGVGARITATLADFVYCKINYNTSLSIRKDLIKRMMKFTTQTYSQSSVGTFVTRLNNDPELILQYTFNILMNVADFLYYLIIVVYCACLNVWVGLTLLVGITLTILFNYIRSKMQSKKEENYNINKDKTASMITEIVKSEKDVKGLKLEDALFKEAYSNTNKMSKSKYGLDKVKLLMTQLNRTISFLLSFALLYVSTLLLSNELLILGAFMFIFTNKDNIESFGTSINEIGTQITSLKISHERLNQIFDEAQYTLESFGDKKLEKCEGKIEFVNVSFSFENDISNNRSSKNNILKNLSFTINSGQMVAIVGKSGSGKTTIMNMIAKMIECNSGTVKIDGINIKQLDKDSIRSNIAIVNQFPYVFDASIKENLLMAKPDATDEELWHVLEKASFAKDVKKYPNKLDTKVGEDGLQLSGGQKQRLSIARALLKNSKIILFDESTSSLDNFAQKDISDELTNLKNIHTIVIVAHRLSTIKKVDKIFFLQDGKIIDEGNFDELFENNESFRNLFMVENI